MSDDSSKPAKSPGDEIEPSDDSSLDTESEPGTDAELKKWDVKVEMRGSFWLRVEAESGDAALDLVGGLIDDDGWEEWYQANVYESIKIEVEVAFLANNSGKFLLEPGDGS